MTDTDINRLDRKLDDICKVVGDTRVDVATLVANHTATTEIARIAVETSDALEKRVYDLESRFIFLKWLLAGLVTLIFVISAIVGIFVAVGVL
jgi:hypothetical protein